MRIWLVLLVSLCVHPLLSMIIGVLAGLLVDVGLEARSVIFWVEATYAFLFVLVLLALLRASRDGAKATFSLGPVEVGIWTLPLMFVGDALALGTGLSLAELLPQSTPEGVNFYAALAEEGSGLALWQSLLIIAASPAILEELLYRGYLQGRLMTRLSPAAAIGLSSVIFTAMHGSLYLTVALLPSALWIGFLAWVSGSIWASMLIHFGSNGLFVLANHFAGGGEDGAGGEAENFEFVPFALNLFLIFLLARVLLWSRRRKTKRPPDLQMRVQGFDAPG